MALSKVGLQIAKSSWSTETTLRKQKMDGGFRRATWAGLATSAGLHDTTAQDGRARSCIKCSSKSIELREIGYVIEQPGRKQQPFVLATTMLEIIGENAVSNDHLAKLPGYHCDVELDIRSIEMHANLHHLRCKSSEVVRREFRVTILVRNAIGTTSLGGLWMTGVKPREVSFVSNRQFVLAA